MKLAPVRSAELLEADRLDARYFAAPAVRIRSKLATAPNVELRQVGDYADVWAPARFRRAYAAPGEDYISYLRPYDVFEYLPPEADRLSISRTENLDAYRIRAGDLLQTCSGRNLGPLTIADSYLARFALSHDMVRITIEDEVDRYYTLAMLKSPTGQSLLRGDLNGSVIDHISPAHVSAIQLPFIAPLRERVAALMREATAMRERARLTLRTALEELNRAFPSPPRTAPKEGWTVTAATLGGRLDAAYHATFLREAQEHLLASGGERLGNIARIIKPGGRPKLYYVKPDAGEPFLSGRQILQMDVVDPKYISRRSFRESSSYGLGAGWIVFQADGRAEESLGHPAVVTDDRADWYASGHVGRAIPNDRADTGWIWAAMASDIVKEQVSALACGSVVDALYPGELEAVVLPPRDAVPAGVHDAWGMLSAAASRAREATELVEASLSLAGV